RLGRWKIAVEEIVDQRLAQPIDRLVPSATVEAAEDSDAFIWQQAEIAMNVLPLRVSWKKPWAMVLNPGNASSEGLCMSCAVSERRMVASSNWPCCKWASMKRVMSAAVVVALPAGRVITS